MMLNIHRNHKAYGGGGGGEKGEEGGMEVGKRESIYIYIPIATLSPPE